MKKRYKYKIVRHRPNGDKISLEYAFFSSKNYRRGSIVTSETNTPGLFCFERLRDAKEFLRWYNLGDDDYEIIRVIPLGKANKPNKNSRMVSLDRRDETENEVPKGTVCYSWIYVVDHPPV